MEQYTQVGQMALRGPTGEPLEAHPIFMLTKDVGGVKKSGLTETEEKACELALDDINEMFARQMQQIEAEKEKLKNKRKKRG